MLARSSRSFIEENAAFERWLRRQCDVVESDLAYKHERMTKSAFVFLRATYFRWARTIGNICPEAARTRRVLGVGDIHVENFGVWRDRDARLVWGVNDFDEAARMPFALDLVRLTVSALLSPDIEGKRDRVATLLLEGYVAGVTDPRPVLLDRDHVSLRPLVMCDDGDRASFWEELDNAKSCEPPGPVRRALATDLPRRVGAIRFVRRPKRGGGSLGRPRYALVAEWRGGAIVREAKAATPSAWLWAHDENDCLSQAVELARGRWRAPDPYFELRNKFFVRRIAPDSRKIEYGAGVEPDVRDEILRLMGQDLGAVHAASGQAQALSSAALALRGPWLHEQAETACAAVVADYNAWAAHMSDQPTKRRRRAKR